MNIQSSMSNTSRFHLRNSLNGLGLNFLQLTIGFMFVVIIEPAPSDLFFVLSLLVVTFSGSLRVDRCLRLFFLMLLLYFYTNIQSSLSWKSASFGARYLAITCYMLLIPLIMAHFASSAGKSAVNNLYRSIFIAGTISSIIGLLAVLQLMPGPITLYFRSEAGLRLSPLFKDPNVFGPFMAMCAVLLIGFSICSKAEHRTKLLTLAVFMLFVMFLSFSRGAWLGTAASAFVFLILMLSFVRERRATTAFFLFYSIGSMFALIGGSVVLYRLGLTDFLVRRFALQSYDSGRFSNWNQTIEVILKQPFGLGPGHYVGRTHFAESEFALATHNLYLKVAVENGWLGFLFFFGALSVILTSIFRSFGRKDDRLPIRIAIFAAIVGQLVSSVAVDSLHWRHFFVLIGFACCELILYFRTPRPSRQ